MSDTEFAATADTASAEAPAQSAPPAATPAATIASATRPAFIPEKFWDGGAGRVRVEDLAKSYRALEQKLGRVAQLRQAEMRRAETNGTSPHASEPLPSLDRVPDSASPGAPERDAAEADAADAGTAAPHDADALDTSVPDSPDAYAVRVSHPWLERDTEIDGLLHAAGFNQAQAQLVYDLAAERVVPVIAGMAAEYEKKMAQGRLEAHFGGPERFAAIARQVKAWGQRHLPPALFETLAATPDGIAALHHMMHAGEPRFLAGDAPAAGPTQDELDTLVRDPRYWRDHQPDLVKRVEEGFRRLYPGA
jgi:hypothetical protein